MPSVYMHAMFTHEVLTSQKKKLPIAHAFLGCHGPNPYRFDLVSEDFLTSKRLGRRLHEEHVKRQCVALINRVKQDYTPHTHAFLIGYLSHAVLDMHVNPYLFYHTGYYTPNEAKTEQFLGRHYAFEEMLDRAFLAHEGALSKKALYRIAFPFKHVPQSVSLLMSDVCASVYHEARGGTLYAKGYKWMRRYYSASKRAVLKRQFVSLVNRFKKGEDVDLGVIKEKGYQESALNLDHAVWYHPLTHTPSTASVLDLYVDALNKMQTVTRKLIGYFFEDEVVDFNQLFGECSMNFGVALPKGHKVDDFKFHRDSGQ